MAWLWLLLLLLALPCWSRSRLPLGTTCRLRLHMISLRPCPLALPLALFLSPPLPFLREPRPSPSSRFVSLSPSEGTPCLLKTGLACKGKLRKSCCSSRVVKFRKSYNQIGALVFLIRLPNFIIIIMAPRARWLLGHRPAGEQMTGGGREGGVGGGRSTGRSSPLCRLRRGGRLGRPRWGELGRRGKGSDFR